jgi:hypothetical protein
MGRGGMITGEWCWVSARSIGTSHIQSNNGCEDSGGAFELAPLKEPIFVAVVSDGAGSAKHAEIGSQVVVREFSREVSKFFREGGMFQAIADETAREWIDGIRDRIFTKAASFSASPRDFAATLVAMIVSRDELVVCHIGDGGCAVRMKGSSKWQSPSWPAHGEYASTTYFVTDDPQAQLRVTRIVGTYDEIAIFSDGIERLALDFAGLVPFDRFFNPMFASFPNGNPGRNRTISRGLRNYLDSKVITDRTDDDKTLIMARRLRP